MAAGLGIYSRVIAILKVGLPLVAVAMLAALFLISNEEAPSGDLVFSPADLDALGEGMQITEPVFSGETDARDRFRFTAARVTPDGVPPAQAEVEMLAGRIDFADGRSLDLQAETARLDLGSRRIALAGAVELISGDGYAFTADRAEADLRTGGLVAQGAVDVDGPMGRIGSDRLTITTGAEGRVLLFEDGVSLVYDPPVAAE